MSLKSMLSLIALAIILGVIHYSAFLLFQLEFRPVLILLYVYLFGLNVIFDLVLMNEDRPNRFVNYYMAFSGGKLMLSLFILLLFGLYDPNYLKPFAASFLLLYFVFTAFEIVRLFKHLKN